MTDGFIEAEYLASTNGGKDPSNSDNPFGIGLGGGVQATFATTGQQILGLEPSRKFDALVVHKDLLLHSDPNAYTALINNRTLNPQELRPYAWLMDRVDAKCRIVMSGEYPDGSKNVIDDGADVYMDGNKEQMPSIRHALQIPKLYDPSSYQNRTRGVLNIGQNNIPTYIRQRMLHLGVDPSSSPSLLWMKYIVTDRAGFTPLIEGVPIQYLDQPTRIEHRGGRREGD